LNDHVTTAHVTGGPAVSTASGRNCGMKLCPLDSAHFTLLSMQMRCKSGGLLSFCRIFLFHSSVTGHEIEQKALESSTFVLNLCNNFRKSFPSSSPFTAADRIIRRFPLSPLRFRSGWTRGTRESDRKEKIRPIGAIHFKSTEFHSNSAPFRRGFDTVASHWSVTDHVTFEISTVSSFFSERR